MSCLDKRDSMRAPRAGDPLSRRKLLSTMAGAGVVLAAALGKSDTAAAQSKTDKKTAKYQDHPNNGQSCAQCNFFRPPKACQLVEGDIGPNGWCAFWAKKPA